MKEAIPICAYCGKRTNKGGWTALSIDPERFSFVCVECVGKIPHE